MRMLTLAAGAAFLILAAGPALAGGPRGGGGEHPGGGCGSCGGGGHPGGGYPGGGLAGLPVVDIDVGAAAGARTVGPPPRLSPSGQ